MMQEQEVQERLSLFESERDKHQKNLDYIRDLRTNIRLQVRSRIQAFDIAIGQVAFGLAGVVGPLLLLADRTPKFQWAIYIGFAVFLAAGIVAYVHHRKGLSDDSHDAPDIGLDVELSVVRMRNAALKGCADPSNESRAVDYQRVLSEEGARLQAPLPSRVQLAIVPDLTLMLLIVGCFLFSSELWLWSEIMYILALSLVVLSLLINGVLNYISALKKIEKLSAKAGLIAREDQNWEQWHQGYQEGRQD